MAGDWIPIRTTLPTAREVLLMASKCGCECDVVLGRLVRFWVWADAESTDGRLPGVTVDMLVRVLRIPASFFSAMASVGWLTIHEGDQGISIPGWTTWFSRSAKARLGEAIRKRLARERERGPPKMSGQVSGQVSGQTSGLQDRIGPDRNGSDSTGTLTGAAGAAGADSACACARVREAWPKLAALWPGARPPPRDAKLALRLLVAAYAYEQQWARTVLNETAEAKPAKPGAYLQALVKKFAQPHEYVWLRSVELPPEISELSKPPPKPVEPTVPATGPPEDPPPEKRLDSAAMQELIRGLKGVQR